MRNALLLVLTCLLTYTAGAQCHAGFTFTTSGLTATFTRTSTPLTAPPNNYITSTIDYGTGSGNVFFGATNSKTYSIAGTYHVIAQIEVYDSLNNVLLCLDRDTQTVTVNYAPCTISISKVTSGNSATFTANNLSSTPGMTYNWNFGDGNTGTGSPVTHMYATNGNYTVTLVASSTTASCSQTDTTDVNVYTPTPCAVSISKITSGNSATFTANNLSSTPGMTYNWNFGDGNTGTGSPVTHMYTATGNYTVTLVASSTTASCSQTDTTDVNVYTPTPCAVSISKITSGNSATFTANNLSSTPGMTYNWNFGDGNTGTGSPVTHMYTATGNYTVTLVASSTTASCSQTDTTDVNVIAQQNIISGFIIADTNVVDTFMVWLIKYDTLSQNLYAVDSIIVSNMPTQLADYIFQGHPAGIYRTKAAQLNGPTSGTGYLPTYHNNSLYWNTAALINHTGGSSLYKNIYMQTGTVTGGPGFVGGNVTMGANKGTASGDPVAGMQIFLRDNANNAIRYTYTDANGYYSFANIPTGLYSIYPEEVGYTTSTASVVLTPTSITENAVNFEKSDGYKTVKPKNTGIYDVTTNTLFSVSPNPSTGIVSINWEAGTKANANVVVTDISGRKVFESVENTNSKTQLNLTELQAGMYFINIHVEGQSAVKQIVIQK